MESSLMNRAADIILNSNFSVAFTGAGISVESGILPFRGENGLWSKIDPMYFELNFFLANPEKSWPLIKKIFYDSFNEAQPNAAHHALANLENIGLLEGIITQNIDYLHQKAGSIRVIEYHGTSHNLTCLECGLKIINEPGLELLNNIPPICPDCNGVIKPDFVFFGEPIPPSAHEASLAFAQTADLFIIIGTTGEIYPASWIPILAKDNGVAIIEVNVEPTKYTKSITDIFLQGKATEIMTKLIEMVLKKKNHID